MLNLLKNVGTVLLGYTMMYIAWSFCYYGTLSFMPRHPDLAAGIVFIGFQVAVLIGCWKLSEHS